MHDGLMDEPERGVSEGVWSRRVYGVLVLCGVSALLALYLSMSGGRVPGCGAGSACDAVLSSRFAKVGGADGVPVSLLALFAYVLLAAASVPSAGLTPMQARLRPIARQAAATGVLVSAVWFVWLQYAVVGGWCAWCMTLHGLGSAAAVLALSVERDVWRGGGVLLGVVMGVTLALSQWFGPGLEARERMAGELPWGGTWEYGYDMVEVDGVLRGEPGRVPMWGDVKSERQVVVMYDLACPHCRSLHGLLAGISNVGVVAVPVPLHFMCNEFVGRNAPSRFAESCERSALAIAVWLAEPTMFEAFDAWCFKGDDVPTAGAMRAHAEALVGAERLQKALDDERTAGMLRAGVTLFGQMKQRGLADVLPIVWETRHGGVLVGAVEDAGQVERLLSGALEAEESVQPVASGG